MLLNHMIRYSNSNDPTRHQFLSYFSNFGDKILETYKLREERSIYLTTFKDFSPSLAGHKAKKHGREASQSRNSS